MAKVVEYHEGPVNGVTTLMSVGAWSDKVDNPLLTPLLLGIGTYGGLKYGLRSKDAFSYSLVVTGIAMMAYALNGVALK